HRRDHDLGKPAAGVAQLLPPAINLPGTNCRAPGDIGDNRARRKRRRDDRSLLLLTPRPAPLGPGENLDSAHPDVLCTSAAPMLAPVRTSGLNRSGGARRPSPEAYRDEGIRTLRSCPKCPVLRTYFRIVTDLLRTALEAPAAPRFCGSCRRFRNAARMPS